MQFVPVPQNWFVLMQVQWPCPLQVVPVGQVMQSTPPKPQNWSVFPCSQKPGLPGPPRQQPGQLLASHWQRPRSHCSNGSQAMQREPPAPQAPSSSPSWHCPLLSQQPEQQAPPGAQPRRSVRQTWKPFSRLQQPLGQVSAEQGGLSRQVPVCVLQCWFEPHCVQVTPPSPQACSVLPGWQTPLLSQQPFGHVCGLQTHLPVF